MYINLHFDCQTTKNWICDKKVNVCQCKNWRKGMMWWKPFTSIQKCVGKYFNWIFFGKQRCCYSQSLFQLFFRPLSWHITTPIPRIGGGKPFRFSQVWIACNFLGITISFFVIIITEIHFSQLTHGSKSNCSGF